MKTINRTRTGCSLALVALAFVACTQDRTMDELTETKVSAAGGTAKSADGKVTLRFPAGALASEETIRIQILRNTLIRNFDGRAKAVEYDLQPSGLTFLAPVEIVIDTEVDAGEDELVLALLPDPGIQGEPQILDTSIHDPTSRRVTASLEHFSRYGLFRRANQCAGLSCGDPCGSGRRPKRCNFNNRCVPVALPLFCSGNPDGGPSFDAGDPDALVGPDLVFPPDPDGGIFPGDGGDGGRLFINEVEPNDPAQNAQFLPIPWGDIMTVSAALQTTSDEDWYWFEVPLGYNGSLHSITHSDPQSLGICDNIDTMLSLYDSSLNLWAQNDDGFNFCAEIGWSFNPSVTTLPAGVYYLKVNSFAASRAFAYYLTVQLDLYFPGQGDGGGIGPDGGGGVDGPTPFDGGSFFDGGPIFDGGSPLDGGRRDGGGFPGDGGVSFDGSFQPDAGGPPYDAGFPSPIVEMEPNDDRATANWIPYQHVTQFRAALMPAGDVDYVQVVIAPGDSLSIFAQTYTDPIGYACNPTVDTVLDLLDSNGAVLATNDDYISQIGCSRIDPHGGHPGARWLPSGTYYVRARHFLTSATAQLYYIDIELF